MTEGLKTRTQSARSPFRPLLRVEQMECRNGPSSLLDPLFALFDWGSAATGEVIDAAMNTDTWQPVYVGTPGGVIEDANPVAQAPGGGGGAPAIPNLPPKIKDFSWTANAGIYTFIGKVEDEQPGGLTVRFGGLTSLEGQSTVTDANGNFSFSVALTNNVNDRGAATAITRDVQGLDSSEAIASVF